MKYFLPVYSEFLTENELNDIMDFNSEYLKKLGINKITRDQIGIKKNLHFFVVTGGTEQQVLDIHLQRLEKFPNEEVILLAHASHNSLPACLEILAKLQQDKVQGKIIYLPQTSVNSIDNYEALIQTLVETQPLKDIRIGLMGKPSDWLVASTPAYSIVQETWGAEIVKISLSEVEQLIKNIDRKNIAEIKNIFTSQANSVQEPTDTEIDDNIRVYLALKKLVDKYDLHALTIRCFDLVLDLMTTGCFALSRLNDDGIIAGCEGDINSTIGMLWAKKKFGKLPWMANPSQINLLENSLILAHCTVPCSLVTNYKIRSHFESGLGVGIQGEFPRQKVTLLRIGGKKLDQIWQAEGNIIHTGNAENLCRTQIEVKLDDDFSVRDLLIKPLGNHLIMV